MVIVIYSLYESNNIHIRIQWHNIAEQWCISTKPCGLKTGFTRQTVFSRDSYYERRDCFEKYNCMSVSRECRARMAIVEDSVSRWSVKEIQIMFLWLQKGYVHSENLFSLLWTVEVIGCDFANQLNIFEFHPTFTSSK